MTDAPAAPQPQPPGAFDVGGVPHLRDAKGRAVPLALISASDQVIDRFVRERLVKAESLRAAIAAFVTETKDEVTALRELLADKYGAKHGGAKGNVSLTTFDGLQRVQVQVADRLTFGPELEAAKSLIDEILNDLTIGSGDDLRVLVQDAFQVDKQGQVNRARILGLARLELKDHRWPRAVKAIHDSKRCESTAEYARFHKRTSPDASWSNVSLDAASA